MIYDEGKIFRFVFKLNEIELRISLPAESKEDALNNLRTNFARYINEINEELTNLKK